MKRKTRRNYKRKTSSRTKSNVRRVSKHYRRSNKKSRSRQSRSRQSNSVIYHNGRRLKLHTLKGGNKFSNVPMSYGYSLGGVELAPENLNLANRPPHRSYKKCF